MDLHSSIFFKGVSCCRRENLYLVFMILSGFRQTYGLGLPKMVQLKLTLMASATSFDNIFVPGLDAEKYFAVNLELIGCKIYTTDI